LEDMFGHRFESGHLHEIVKPALAAGFCILGSGNLLYKVL
jgi:hypothetical protein